ncbi:hypothetical protein RCL_jg9573.t1 [Rhizophagus clarus]|uniref:Uncharacterized protein n=1 Tax=Rhizophagus clarus TaxID=94130 RepID=A0A8H3LDK8_9GLOM|nr:hypothetical protein RCL_jg9573.t1 [Rhizophagus clarus]
MKGAQGIRKIDGNKINVSVAQKKIKKSMNTFGSDLGLVEKDRVEIIEMHVKITADGVMKTELLGVGFEAINIKGRNIKGIKGRGAAEFEEEEVLIELMKHANRGNEHIHFTFNGRVLFVDSLYFIDSIFGEGIVARVRDDEEALEAVTGED